MLIYVISVIMDIQEVMILKHVKVVMLTIVFHVKSVHLILVNYVNKAMKALIVHPNV